MIQNVTLLQLFLLALCLYTKTNILASVFRELCVWNCKQANDRLSWQKSL